MPELTVKQQKFVDEVSCGMRQGPAARCAGYQNPVKIGSQLMRHPKVLEALQRNRAARLQGDIASKALSTLEEIITDKEGAPASVRYQAARYILEQAGHRVADGVRDHAKPLEEMNPAELAQAVQHGMQALTDLAGQLEGGHAVEGEWRQIQEIDAEDPSEPVPDFLQ